MPKIKEKNLLKSIINKIVAQKLPMVEFDLRNWLDEIDAFHWVYQISIMSILEVDYLKLEYIFRWKKVNFQMFMKEEFSPDVFIQKILLLVICFYCISTETRFLKQLYQGDGK
jgi:hypothetical protein